MKFRHHIRNALLLAPCPTVLRITLPRNKSMPTCYLLLVYNSKLPVTRTDNYSSTLAVKQMGCYTETAVIVYLGQIKLTNNCKIQAV